MHRWRILSACFLAALPFMGGALADKATAQPPGQGRFSVLLPFLRLDRSPAPLSLTTEAHLGGAGSGVAIDGERAYQVKGGRLLVWDLADPVAAQVIGRLDLPLTDAPGTVIGDGGIVVVLQQRSCGPVLVVAGPESDIQRCIQAAVIDATDGHAPQLMSTMPIDGQRAIMSRWDRFLYIAALSDRKEKTASEVTITTTSQLLAFDLERPGDPSLTSRVINLPEISGLVAGQRLVAGTQVAQGHDNILLFDSNKGHLQHGRVVDVGAYRSKLFVVGERLWMMSWNGALWSWRWQSGKRFDRQLKGGIPIRTSVIDQAIDLNGQLCTFDTYYESIKTNLLGTLNALSCFDVGNPEAPALTESMTVNATEPLLYLAGDNGRLLLSSPARGSMILVDLKVPGNRRQLELEAGPGGIGAILRKGDLLFSWEHQGRMRRWNLGSPIGPQSVGKNVLPADAPSIISTDLSGSGPAGRWLLHGLYVPDQFSPRIVFSAIDLADPENPKVGPSRSWDPEVAKCSAWSFTASGDLVWMQGSHCSGQAQPQPVRVQRVEESGYSWIQVPDLDAMSDQVLWLGARPLVLGRGAPGGDSLTVVDEDYQTVLSKVEGLGRVRAAAIEQSRMYIAGSDDGPRTRAWLLIVDLSMPRTPRIVERFDLPTDEPSQLFASNARLLVAGWSAKSGGQAGEREPAFCTLDISSPESPTLEGCVQSTRPPSAPTGWAFDPDGQHLYIADNGLTVLRLDLPGTVPNIRTYVFTVSQQRPA